MSVDSADQDRVHIVRGDECTTETAQTAGMTRMEALSGRRVGAAGLWMGQTVVAPGAESGPHHHGRSETAIYVVSGNPVFTYADGEQQVRLSAHPGDYVYIPPFVAHVEGNPSPDEEAVIVLARSTQEAIVENLDRLV